MFCKIPIIPNYIVSRFYHLLHCFPALVTCCTVFPHLSPAARQGGKTTAHALRKTRSLQIQNGGRQIVFCQTRRKNHSACATKNSTVTNSKWRTTNCILPRNWGPVCTRTLEYKMRLPINFSVQSLWIPCGFFKRQSDVF